MELAGICIASVLYVSPEIYPTSAQYYNPASFQSTYISIRNVALDSNRSEHPSSSYSPAPKGSSHFHESSKMVRSACSQSFPTQLVLVP